MFLRTIRPHPELAPFIHHFWVFESQSGLPSGDARVVVPNGRPKLIVPYRNGLTAQRFGVIDSGQHHGAGDCVVIGLWEEPTIISSTPEPTCTIGVEFLPHGLTRFLPLQAAELTQRVVPLGDVLGRVGRDLGRRVGSAESVDEAIELVLGFLRESFARAQPAGALVDAALAVLREHDYQLEINELERRMGYSRRYLQSLFLRQIGLPPKRLASVLAFERLYRRFSQDKSIDLLKRDALELFYDQPHFIRTFRRFTGFAPGRFAELENEFGRIFYLRS